MHTLPPPSAFLTEPKSSLGVKQSVVLAVMRAVYSATGGDLKLNLSESNDKRVFVRPAPMYLTPVVSGAVGGTTGVTNIDALHSGQTGSLSGSRLGAIWQSYNADGGVNLYYSAKDNGGTRHTHLLGPTYVNVSSPSSNQTFTMGSNRIFVLTPSTTINLNPSGTFPQGYMVFVDVPSGSTVTFDSSGVNTAIASGTGAVFAYSGSAWKKVLSSGGGGGIASVVADTTPQLGGDLDVNGNKIVSASSGNIEIEPNGTGDIILDGDVTIDASHTFRATTLPVVDINSDPNPLVLNTHAGRYLLCSSNVTLPATSTQGDQYYILNDSGSSISILRNGNNINGAASDVTLTSYKGATCIAIGSNNWIVLVYDMFAGSCAQQKVLSNAYDLNHIKTKYDSGSEVPYGRNFNFVENDSAWMTGMRVFGFNMYITNRGNDNHLDSNSVKMFKLAVTSSNGAPDQTLDIGTSTFTSIDGFDLANNGTNVLIVIFMEQGS